MIYDIFDLSLFQNLFWNRILLVRLLLTVCIALKKVNIKEVPFHFYVKSQHNSENCTLS